MKKIATFLWSKIWYIAVISVILAALLLSLIRLLMPLATEYREDVEILLSALLDQPVKIKSMEAEWHGFSPVLRLKDVQLFEKDKEVLVIRFDEALVGFDIWTSIFEGQPVPGKVNVIGTKLSIVRHEDGRITIEGLDLPELDAGEARAGIFADWLFRQEAIAIEGGHIHWHDKKRKAKPLSFTDITLSLENDGDHHVLTGKAKLPDELGKTLLIIADFTGDLSKPHAWEGQLYTKGARILIAEWLGEKTLTGIRTSKGISDFELWSEWEKGGVREITGNIHLNDLQLQMPDNNKSTGFKQIGGKIAWRRTGTQWHLNVDKFVLATEEKVWPESRLSVSASPDSGEYKVEANYISLAEITTLLLSSSRLTPEQRSAISALQPSGELQDVMIRYAGRKQPAERFNIKARFDDLSLNPWSQVPLVKGLDGSIHSEDGKGELQLESYAVEFNVELMFREALRVNALNGRITWSVKDGVWNFKTTDLALENDDLSGKLTMELELPESGASPYISMEARYENVDGSNASKYFPVSIMPGKAVKWLDTAIVSGHVTWGELHMQGKMEDFPFKNGNGKFEVRFNVDDVILDYAKDWPRIEELDAEVIFSGSEMTINGISGKVLDSEIYDITAIIPDLDADEQLLKVTGKSSGTLTDGVRFISQSPLDEKFGNYLIDLDTSGQVILDLALDIPLNEKPNKLSGNLKFDDGTIYMKGWNVILDKINGDLRFTENNIDGNKIRANILGRDSTVNVYMKDADKSRKSGKRSIVIESDIRISIQDLANRFKHPLFSYLQGESDWNIKLIIPEAEWQEEVIADLQLTSNLKGVSINLPQPFKKDVETMNRLVIETRLIKDPFGFSELPRRLFIFSYRDDIKGGFILQETPEGMITERGEINFGGELGDMPDPGLVITGKIDKLDVDKWLKILVSTELDTGASLTTRAYVDLISRAEMNINEIRYLQNRFENVAVAIEKHENNWQADIKSDAIAGVVTWNKRDRNQLVTLNLDVLKLPGHDDETIDARPETVDPRLLPYLKITSRQFFYQGIDLGSLDLEATSHPEGLVFDRINLEFDDGSITANGDWMNVNDKHTTRLNIKLDSKDIGKTLTRFGFSETVEAGTAANTLAVQWAGTPQQFSLSRLNGAINVNMQNGRFLDIEPGVGRVFGLLSLQSIPRRLSLDFSDLFKKGFAFDKIEGDLTMENGNAYTNNMVMDGPSAKVELSGRTGLVMKDYDQYVTVTPKLTASLPVAGALIGGPVVGAAILAIEHIFKGTISDITQYHYTITGSWDNPLIESIEKKSLDAETGKEAEVTS
jgi:uncharacterized protein (TIGR02099 family)